MYLMALPTNVPEKWGARLLEHLSGEAEELLEAVDIDDITKDQGWKLVLDTLDEKYKEASKDELQRVMKDYFYTICIKEQETYRYFITRLDTAYKALVRNGVELPDEVRGWMLLKKLALEPNSESMILTASQGSVKYVKIMQAVRNVFPHGKSLKTAKTKDIFVTEQEDYHRRGGTEGPPESDGEPLEVMETIATQLQEAEDYESEDALDTYETYTTVRKKMQEKKINRGYKPTSSSASSWQLTGSVRGRIEALEQKTKCHLCRRRGHWKKECPLKSKDKGAEKEVHRVEIVDSEDESYDIYTIEASVNDEYQETKNVMGKDKTSLIH